MKPPALDELIEEILTKVRAGTMSAQEGQAAIKRLIEEAGTAASAPVEESAAEQRIKSAARQARRMA